MSWVLVDLDGTLCDTSHREHLLDKKPRDWQAYSMACANDALIGGTAQIVEAMAGDGLQIALVTGRNEEARESTVQWLRRNGIPWTVLMMRQPGDHRRNPELKHGVAQELIDGGASIRFAIDDHPGVAKAYAELGIMTYLVARPVADKGILVEVAEQLASQGTTLPAPVAEALALIRDTFGRKNADYAKDSIWRSNFDAIAAQMGFDAVAAADTLIAVKQARLQALTANGRDPANESTFDTYLDRTVYAVIALALLLDEQR